MARSYGFVRNALVVLAAASAAAAGWCAPLPLDEPGTLAQEVDAARKAGISLRSPDVDAPAPPAVRNAATYYRRLAALRKSRPITPAIEAVERLAGRLPLTGADLALARRGVAERAADLALIHRAAGCADCNFGRRTGSDPGLIAINEFATMRSAARWLSLEAGVQLADRRPVEAARTMALGLRVASHASAHPFLIDYLVAVAIDAITVRSLESILYASGGDAATARVIQRAVASRAHPPSLSAALRGEAAMCYSEMQRLRARGPDALKQMAPDSDASQMPQVTAAEWGPWVDASAAYILWHMRHLAAAADLPTARQRDAALAPLTADIARREAARDKTVGLAGIVAPVFGNVPNKMMQHRALCGALEAAAAVLAWHADHAAWPVRLDQAMDRVPLDPIDASPLRYRREGVGFVVYSVGQTGAFTGGSATVQPARDEVVFRWPRPAYRDRRPTPPPGSGRPAYD